MLELLPWKKTQKINIRLIRKSSVKVPKVEKKMVNFLSRNTQTEAFVYYYLAID